MNNGRMLIGIDPAYGEDKSCAVVAEIRNGEMEILKVLGTEQEALRYIARQGKHLRLVICAASTTERLHLDNGRG